MRQPSRGYFPLRPQHSTWAITLAVACIASFRCIESIDVWHGLGNMSMNISTPVADAQRYFDQGLRFTATFKFDFAVESHLAALELDPNCAMCEWGLALAYGQNLNDALVMALEPDFLSNEPLAYEALERASALLDKEDGSQRSRLTYRRDTVLISALKLKFCASLDEYKSYFVDGLPVSLNTAYAEAMEAAATMSLDQEWGDRAMVLVLSGDAWMNISPWDYWEDPDTMRPNAQKARARLEASMALDPDNAWAIHLYTHLLEAGGDAAAAVPHAKKLQYLMPRAAHLQHMPSHVEFRTGEWHEASGANLRAVALPNADASYPDHNMDMLMWSLGVEGRCEEVKAVGRRLTEYSRARVEANVTAPLLPPERFLAQEALHLAACADWEGVFALDEPPAHADFPMAAYHFARSLAFAEAKNHQAHQLEQQEITANLDRMEGRTDYYGIYNAPTLTRILDLLSRAEGLRALTDTSGNNLEMSSDGHRLLRGAREMTEQLHLQARSSKDPGASQAAATLESNTSFDKAVPSSSPCGASDGLNAVPAAVSAACERGALAAAMTTLASSTLTSKGDLRTSRDELELLREAMIYEDSLGYDEPPQMPIRLRLYVAAAYLRSLGDMPSAEVQAMASSARDLLLEADAIYPRMGRTLFGLWAALSTSGSYQEATVYKQQFLESWQYADVWLVDSAHVGGFANAEGSKCVDMASERGTVQQERGSGRASRWAVPLLQVVCIVAIATALVWAVWRRKALRDTDCMACLIRRQRGYRTIVELVDANDSTKETTRR